MQVCFRRDRFGKVRGVVGKNESSIPAVERLVDRHHVAAVDCQQVLAALANDAGDVDVCAARHSDDFGGIQRMSGHSRVPHAFGLGRATSFIASNRRKRRPSRRVA